MATKEVEVIVSEAPAIVQLDWLAIIYSPHKERDGLRDEMAIMAGLPVVQRMPACRHFQLPPQKPAGWKEGQAQESRSIQLNPGTNLGISVTDWQALMAADEAKRKRGEVPALSLMIERGAIVSVTPDIDSYGPPGYRHFSLVAARQLVAMTFHEDWLAKWADLETRPEIIKATTEARASILERKRKAAA